jgi:hypothetical protein
VHFGAHGVLFLFNQATAFGVIAVIPLGTTVLQYTVSNLDAAIHYLWQLRAGTTAGFGPWSTAITSVYTPPPPAGTPSGDSSSSSSSSGLVVIVVAVVVAVCVFAVLLIVFLLRRRRRNVVPSNRQRKDTSTLLATLQALEIAPGSVEIGRKIGEGFFGTVSSK